MLIFRDVYTTLLVVVLPPTAVSDPGVGAVGAGAAIGWNMVGEEEGRRAVDQSSVGDVVDTVRGVTGG